MPQLNASIAPLVVTCVLAACMALGLLRAVFLVEGLVLLRRLFNCLSLLYLTRGLCLLGTRYPDPQPVCKSPDFHWKTWNVLGIYMLDTCGDLMFSGHAVHMWLCTLAAHRYTENVIVKWAMMLFPIAGCIVVLAARFHYSGRKISVKIALLNKSSSPDDIIIGFIFTVCYW